MQSPLTRPSLNRSAFVALLAELALVDHPAAPPSFVEGLSQWLGWKEAIPLSAAMQAPPARPHDRAAAGPAATLAAAAQDFSRVRQALERAVADTSSTAREDGASFVPFRRRYFSLQQAMESAIGPLRQRLRAALARQQGAHPLLQLAALDAAMAEALAGREQSLLGVMPVLLEKHFSRLRQAALDAAPAHSTSPHTPPAWLARFRHDMQRLLLAELDLRLQPAQGLLDTLQAAPTESLAS